jgi:dephospho-CoA kinase
MLLFEDETFKNNYQSIIHPIIKKEVLKGIKTSKNDIIKDNKKRILFLDVPLLYEASFDELCDNVLIINAEEEVIYQRIRKRNNLSDSDIAAILRNQLSFDEKIKRAKTNLDSINQSFYVIDNSTDLDSLYLKIDEYLHKLNK